MKQLLFLAVYAAGVFISFIKVSKMAQKTDAPLFWALSSGFVIGFIWGALADYVRKKCFASNT